MPIGTKVHNCVDKLRKKMPYGVAIAICQKSTQQNYMTGEPLKRKSKSKSKSKSKKKSHQKHMFKRIKKSKTKRKSRKD